MAMTYERTTGTESGLTTIQINGDGTTNVCSIALQKAPLVIPFTTASSFPTAVDGPISATFGASAMYNIAYSLVPATYRLVLTFTPQGAAPTNPVAGTQTTLTNIYFVYPSS